MYKRFFSFFYWFDFINFYLGGTFHIANEKGGMYVVYIGAFLVRTKNMFLKKSFSNLQKTEKYTSFCTSYFYNLEIII